MKIGIIGSGIVAKTLGTGFLKNGHEVMLGTRDPSKLSEWKESEGKRALTGSFEEAAAFGVIVVLAVAGEVAVDAVRQAGNANFDAKPVIEVSNALDFSAGVPPKFTAAVGDSVAERVQRAIPGAHVVKAFNMVSSAVMTDPKFGDDFGTLFIAGDDTAAKKTTTQLAEEFGWEVLDFGGLGQAFYLEAFAAGFINYAFGTNDWMRSIRFLKK